MMKILCVGKIKEKYFVDGIAHYSKQIQKQTTFSIIECPDEATPDNASAAQEDMIRRMEGERILSHIHDGDFVVALCIEGKQYSTEKWIKRLGQWMQNSRGDLVFVIGGSLGLDPKVLKRANEGISFSDMTFPHQLMRMILCEQLAVGLQEIK